MRYQNKTAFRRAFILPTSAAILITSADTELSPQPTGIQHLENHMGGYLADPISSAQIGRGFAAGTKPQSCIGRPPSKSVDAMFRPFDDENTASHPHLTHIRLMFLNRPTTRIFSHILRRWSVHHNNTLSTIILSQRSTSSCFSIEWTTCICSSLFRFHCSRFRTLVTFLGFPLVLLLSMKEIYPFHSIAVLKLVH